MQAASNRPPSRATAVGRYGRITHYLPNPRAGGRRVGTPSDDTQLTF